MTGMMKRLAIGCALALAAPAWGAAPKVGEPAPDFEVEMLDRTRVRLSELRGQVVVLNLWATWCGPCKAELPMLDGFYGVLKDRGLRVFALTTEDSLPLARLKPLAAVMTIPMVRRMKGPYRVLGGVPTNYIFDKAGVLRYAKAAAFDLATLNALLIPLLNEKAPQGPGQDVAAR